MADLLDELISDQNARGLRGPSAAQIGTGNAAVVQTPQITVAPNSGAAENKPVFFEQSVWNQNPWEEDRNLALDDMRTRIAARRFELERAQAQAPLQDRLLEAQIGASGAHDRFLREQDAQTLQHTQGFLNALADPNTPNPGDPAWNRFMIGQLAKYPRIAETAGGKDLLSKLGVAGDTHTSIADIGKRFGVDTVKSVNVGSNGRASVTLTPSDPEAKMEKVAKDYGLTLGRIRNPVGAQVGRRGKKGEQIDGKDAEGRFIGDEAGDVIRVEGEDGKMVSLPVAEYQRLGGKLSPEGAAKRGAAPAVDKSALARKALADPNAPENIKAAARKRLGL